MKSFIGSKKFYIMALSLAIPGMLQQLITSLAQMVDNLMVGSLGKDAIAGVGVANQIFFIFSIVSYGICASAGIFISQYLGAKNSSKVKETFRISLIFNMIFAVIVFLILLVFNDLILRLFIIDSVTLAVTKEYLLTVLPMYLIVGVSFAYSSAFRYEGQPKLSLYAGVVAVVVNTFLNYLLINGNLGFMALGVRGAAIATIVSRIAEFTLLLLFSTYLKTNVYTKVSEIFKVSKALIFAIINKGKSLIANEVLWASGIVVANVILTKRQTDYIAALNISTTVTNLMFIGSLGLSASVVTIIGGSLGAKDFNRAKLESKYLVTLALMIGIVLGAIVFGLANIVPNLYNVSSYVSNTATKLLYVSASFSWNYYVTMALFFIIRSGGDTKGVLIMDSGVMWLLYIPFAALLGFTSLSITERFLLIQIVEMFKLFLAIKMYSTHKWLNNLTTI